jgi:hypothetical protein
MSEELDLFVLRPEGEIEQFITPAEGVVEPQWSRYVVTFETPCGKAARMLTAELCAQ